MDFLTTNWTQKMKTNPVANKILNSNPKWYFGQGRTVTKQPKYGYAFTPEFVLEHSKLLGTEVTNAKFGTEVDIVEQLNNDNFRFTHPKTKQQKYREYLGRMAAAKREQERIKKIKAAAKKRRDQKRRARAAAKGKDGLNSEEKKIDQGDNDDIEDEEEDTHVITNVNGNNQNSPNNPNGNPNGAIQNNGEIRMNGEQEFIGAGGGFGQSHGGFEKWLSKQTVYSDDTNDEDNRFTNEDLNFSFAEKPPNPNGIA